MEMNDFKEILQEIQNTKVWRENSLGTILRKYPKEGKGLYRHDELVREYRELVSKKEILPSKKIERRIRRKPTRTLSGVATVTVQI